ncbi:MAG: glycosyltransferase [Desulfuromonadales bacterium]|nr:glycosyltransferase [Desulfuromonadales bacterium]
MHEYNSHRIKTLIVNGSLQVGGAEMQIARLAPQIDQRVFDVQVAYYNNVCDRPLEMLKASGIPVRYLGDKTWSRRRYFKDAFIWMRNERFDLVHAWSSSANHYARIPAILAGVPVIIGGLRGKSGLDWVWPYAYSVMNLKCSGWIVNSIAMQEFAMKEMSFMKKAPIRVIRNGFDCGDEQIFRRGEQTFYDKIKRGVPVIGIVGRLHPVKNHVMFLSMAKKISDGGFDADYWIIGDGPERASIESAIDRNGLHGKVHLLGLRDDVDVALSRMDLLVLTSRSESCPNVLLEAMRASLPVVATNCTYLHEIIHENVNGYVVPVDDVDTLAQRVRSIVCDQNKRIAMGESSRALVKERFSIKAATQDLEQAYRFFLKRTRKKRQLINAKLTHLESC